MTDFADILSLRPFWSDPPGETDDRLEALTRLRWRNDRRVLEALRWRRSLIAFAAIWAVVPFAEAITAMRASAFAFVLHLGLVAPWALLVGAMPGRTRRSMPVDLAAAAVMLVAVFAVLAGHRVVPDPALLALDSLAVVPLLFLCLWVRPRPRIAVTTVVLGLTAVGLATAWAPAPAAAIGWATPAIAGVVALIGLAAGLALDREIAEVHLARVRADLAAHSLTHRNDELRILSEVDTLTGLANRRSIDRRLPEIAERSLVEGETIGVMMIDVDHFKRFNDRFGHQEGDRCLVETARAAAEQIRRKDDLIGRFGGEEFLAVLPGAGLEVTMRVAERIRAAVQQRAIPAGSGDGRVVTVSIGCAAGVVTQGWTIEDILRAADEQLYAAKRGGRNRISPPCGDPPEDVNTRAAA